MNKTVILSLLAFCVLFCSCGKEVDTTPTMQDAKPIVLTKAQQEIVGRNNTFSFNLFQKLAAKEKGSFLYSPFSVESVFSMLLNAAEGDTYSQIASSLGYTDYSIDDINSMYAAVVKGLTEADKTVLFNNANSLWTNNFDAPSSFSKVMTTYYSAYMKKLDFPSTNAVSAINDWASKQTNGKINNLVEDLDPNGIAVLVNAVFFEGSWKHKFSTQLTTDEDFYLWDGSTKKVKMMHRTQELIASQVDGHKLCLLPFGNGAFQLALILPSEDAGGKDFFSSLDITDYQALRAAKKTYNVFLSVPRILLESNISDNLKNALIELGIQDAFDKEKGNFPILLDQPLCVNEIKQKSLFQMDEEGAKFATATKAKGEWDEDDLPPQPLEFNANRPFAFLIYENSTGTILLMGEYSGN